MKDLMKDLATDVLIVDGEPHECVVCGMIEEIDSTNCPEWIIDGWYDGYILGYQALDEALSGVHVGCANLTLISDEPPA